MGWMLHEDPARYTAIQVVLERWFRKVRGVSVSDKRWSTSEEEAAMEAPATFRQAIMRDPYSGLFRLDQDSLRGEPLIRPEDCLPGDSVVPKSGYYVDLDGKFIDWYHEGNRFPKYSPVAGAGGRFFFITSRRDAPTSDLLYILLRAGYPGDIMQVAVQ